MYNVYDIANVIKIGAHKFRCNLKHWTIHNLKKFEGEICERLLFLFAHLKVKSNEIEPCSECLCKKTFYRKKSDIIEMKS